MSIIHYNKLVRDKIPQIIEQSGKKAHIRKMSLDEYKQALKYKLIEEAQELLEAETEEQIIEELVDCLEVVQAILDVFIIYSSTKKRRLEKREEKGGFDKKICLLYVEDQAEE